MASTKLTRADLYDLVWRTPMSRLAAEFGVSDVALAKTCRRLSVPRPGRGYWAQIAAGNKVKQPPLGKAPPGTKEWTLVERFENPTPRPPRPEVPKASVPTDLRDAPEAIRRLGLALGSSKKDQYARLVVAGTRDPILAVTIATHRRALLLLAALAAALDVRGHSLVFGDDGASPTLSVVIGEDIVGVSLVERLDRKDHVLTPDEERRAATGSRYGIPRHDQFASGRLQLVMHGVHAAITSWSDTKTRTLDRQLGAAIVAAESEAQRRREALRAAEERRLDDERRRAADEEERRRQRVREARAQHRQRLAIDLRQMARAWSEAEEMRRFLRTMRDSLPIGARDERTTAWLLWADAYVVSLDPLSDAASLAKEVELDDEQPPRGR